MVVTLALILTFSPGEKERPLLRRWVLRMRSWKIQSRDLGRSREKLSDGDGENFLHFGRHVRGGPTRLVAALFVSDGRADVPWGVIPVRRHGHEQVRARSFGGELIFDERFAGQVQNSRAAQAQATDVKLAARLAAAQPGKFGSLALRG